MNNSFYDEDELNQIGFASVGNNVYISRKASIYSAELITIGDNVRIDDFCILSGKIKIGNFIHIAAYSGLFGGEKGISIADYSNVSSRVCIYAVSDDFSGMTMTNPMIPQRYKNVCQESVIIEKHVIIGSGSTVLPGVIIREGTAIGAMSLCNQSTQEWEIYAGIPMIRIKTRKKELLELASRFESELKKEYNT